MAYRHLHAQFLLAHSCVVSATVLAICRVICAFILVDILKVAQSLMTSFLTQENQCAIDIVSDFVWDDCQPFRGTSSDFLLIVLEPFLNVDKVSKKRALVARMYHPYDET